MLVYHVVYGVVNELNIFNMSVFLNLKRNAEWIPWRGLGSPPLPPSTLILLATRRVYYNFISLCQHSYLALIQPVSHDYRCTLVCAVFILLEGCLQRSNWRIQSPPQVDATSSSSICSIFELSRRSLLPFAYLRAARFILPPLVG